MECIKMQGYGNIFAFSVTENKHSSRKERLKQFFVYLYCSFWNIHNYRKRLAFPH